MTRAGIEGSLCKTSIKEIAPPIKELERGQTDP
jgi:hypothetical protein